MEKGIKIAYDTLTMDELREAAWEVIEPFYLEKKQTSY